MDIFSHGLWTGLYAKILNKKVKKPLNTWFTVFFGVFPDLFAFTIPILWTIIDLVVGKITFADLPRPEAIEPVNQNLLPIFRTTHLLYDISHSLIIFFLVVVVLFIIFRKVILELSGWLLHILIDIPTHSYRFYPTPFLWPISGIKFNGLSWATPWFIIINYSAIIFVYLILRKAWKVI